MLKQVFNHTIHLLDVVPLVLPLFTTFKVPNPIGQPEHLDYRVKFSHIYHHICSKRTLYPRNNQAFIAVTGLSRLIFQSGDKRMLDFSILPETFTESSNPRPYSTAS